MKEIRSNDIKILEELSMLLGPSGFEGRVAAYIEERVKPLCDDCIIDKMGNLIALIRLGDTGAPNRRRVMLSAHTDEVGVMITEICSDGLLRFDTVGGINVSVLEGRKIILCDERGDTRGLVMSKAIHHIPRKDRSKAHDICDLYIDIGAKTKEEAEAVVSIGTLGTFDSEFYLFGENSSMIKGKALDDRMGCYALMAVMEALCENRPEGNYDLYFCFTVREEIGLSGARVAANKIAPDIAIVLESTAVADLPDVADSKKVAGLGRGGALSIADRATIYDKELLSFALELGKKENIPVQTKRYVSGGNDAGSIHKSGVGVRCLALSVPTRYLHSPACVASLSDFRSISALVEAMIRNLSSVL